MVKDEIKAILDETGIKTAGWVITGTILVVGVAFIVNKYIEMRKLRVDYKISQYTLQKEQKQNPDFKAK